MRLATLPLVVCVALLSAQSAPAASYRQIGGTIIDPIRDNEGVVHPYSGANLQQGVVAPGASLGDADLFLADLRIASLANAILTGATLTDANMAFADLGSAELGGADLSNANLISAFLDGANLSAANLSAANSNSTIGIGADLSGANLHSANLTDAGLFGANLSSVSMIAANLNGADLRVTTLTFANLSDADLSDALLREANLRDAILTLANLSGARLNGALLGNAALDGAILTDAWYDESTEFPSGMGIYSGSWDLPGGAAPWNLGMIPVPEPAGGLMLGIGSVALAALTSGRSWRRAVRILSEPRVADRDRSCAPTLSSLRATLAWGLYSFGRQELGLYSRCHRFTFAMC